MLTKCDNCGKQINIHGKKRKSWKHHFCNRFCYTEYRLKHPEMMYYNKKAYNWDMQKKLAKLAELRKNKRKFNKLEKL